MVSVALLIAGCQLVFPIDDQAGGPVTCPTFYTPESTGIYFQEPTLTTWAAADGKCRSHGPNTHLVVISDAIEFDVVRGLLNFDQGFSIGLSDRQSQLFEWVTVEPSTFAATPNQEPWAPNEPNNGLGGVAEEDCVVVRDDGLLNDAICATFQTGFVCECDQFARRSQ